MFWKQKGSQVDQQVPLQRSELNGFSKLQDVKATTESTLNESHTPEDSQQNKVYGCEQATEDRLWKPKALQQTPQHHALEQHTSVLSPSPLTIKVILLGDYGIGKIRFLEALSQGASGERGGVRCTDYRWREFVELLTYSRGRRVRVKIMNTAGQERFRSVTSSYYRDVQGCLLTFSVTQQESFGHVMHWHSELQRYCHTASDRLLLLGLRTTPQSRDGREVTSERAFKMAEGLGTRYLETTMADTEMLLWIVQQITDTVSQQVVPATKPGQIITISPPLGKKQPRRKRLCASS